MHLLVDIRIDHPRDIIRQNYGISWVNLWKKYHPDDIYTFLTLEGASISEPHITMAKREGFFGTKKIAHHKNGPDRIISFSRLEPIRHTIPYISHIFDSGDILFPKGGQSFFERKYREKIYKNHLHGSDTIIVPHIEIGMELVEMFNIPEEKIAVIPYHIPEIPKQSFGILHPYGLMPGYWIVEGKSTDEWNPMKLLQAYSRYIHEYSGTKRLIITGDLGENLKYISECIRGLNIMEYVKILGVLPENDMYALYEYGSGWISIGGYYSGNSTLAYAISAHLPILASDIAPIRDYADLLIHPNHTDQLAEKLLLLSRLETGTEKYTHSPHALIDVYARVIAESACK